MARYIDADKLAEAIDRLIADGTAEWVKRGKWEWESGDTYGSTGLRCSRCGALKDSIYDSYCPNCGALMEVRVPTNRVHEEATTARMIDADKLIDQIERKYGMDPMYFVDNKTPWGRQAEIDAALIELLERAAEEETNGT